MAYCYECGALTTDGDGIPACPEHGPLWKLVRNAAGANVVAVRPRDGAVLLGRRAREPHVGAWEVPGGFVDLGEHPADAAVRELEEEVGITATLTGLLGIYVYETPLGDWIQATTYVGSGDGDPRPEPEEMLDAAWFPPDRLPDGLAPTHRVRLADWQAGRAVPLPARTDARRS